MMSVQMHMDPMDRLSLRVLAAIERAIPGIPIASEGSRTGVVLERGRNAVTVYFRDRRSNCPREEKAQFQRRFLDRSQAELAANPGIGPQRVSRVKALTGREGLRITLA